METRRNIHDERNSIAGPRPGAKNLRRRQAKFEGESVIPRKDREYKTMPFEPKLVANTICVWCTAETITDSAFVICPRCHACQYCGLVGKHPDNCFFCGNAAEPDMIREKSKRFRATQSPQETRKIAHGPVTHSGPQTRSRRPGMRRSV